jgi:hypothetical protein
MRLPIEHKVRVENLCGMWVSGVYKNSPLVVMSLISDLVGPGGLEPPTSTTSMWRSSQMS